MRSVGRDPYRLSTGSAPVKRLLWAVCVALAGCGGREIIRVNVCPEIPAILSAGCAECLPGDPAPTTNGQLAEAWMACRSCVNEDRLKLAAIKELAVCR